MSGFSALLLLFANITAPVAGEVTYVHADRLYIDLGQADGVTEKTRINIYARGKKVATADVVLAADHTSMARYQVRNATPRPGDRAVAVRTRRPTPLKAPPLPPAPATTAPAWASQPYAKVDESRTIQARAIPRARSSAHLRSQSWVYVDARDNGLFQRASLDLWVDGPLDERERFWLEADMGVSGQLTTPPDARDRDGAGVWIDVYRAALSWRPTDELELGLGRSPRSGMRWGLVDGAFVAYRPSDLIGVEVAAGARPDPGSLEPTRTRPIAAMNLDGDLTLEGAHLHWYTGGSWLGDDAEATEAIEGTAGLRVDAAGRFWVDADAGALYVPGAGGDLLVLDRASLWAASRYGDALVRIGGRRLQAAAPPSDAAALSPVYGFGARPVWEASTSVDTALYADDTAAVSGGASAGMTFSEAARDGERHERYWAYPTALLRLSRWGRPWVRLGYRAEGGWMAAHLGEIAVGVRPNDRLSVSLWQQVGVRMVQQSGLLLATGSSWLRVNYQLWDALHVTLRGRAIYLDTGTGVELDARFSLLDWL